MKKFSSNIYLKTSISSFSHHFFLFLKNFFEKCLSNNDKKILKREILMWSENRPYGCQLTGDRKLASDYSHPRQPSFVAPPFDIAFSFCSNLRNQLIMLQACSSKNCRVSFLPKFPCEQGKNVCQSPSRCVHLSKAIALAPIGLAGCCLSTGSGQLLTESCNCKDHQ